MDALVARWRTEDPLTSVDGLAARPGCGVIEHDVAASWRRMVLELRGDDVDRTRRWIPLLVHARIRAAAPYLLSLLRRPRRAEVPQLEREEVLGIERGRYGPAYETLADYVARLGDVRGREALRQALRG